MLPFREQPYLEYCRCGKTAELICGHCNHAICATHFIAEAQSSAIGACFDCSEKNFSEVNAASQSTGQMARRIMEWSLRSFGVGMGGLFLCTALPPSLTLVIAAVVCFMCALGGTFGTLISGTLLLTTTVRRKRLPGRKPKLLGSQVPAKK